MANVAANLDATSLSEGATAKISKSRRRFYLRPAARGAIGLGILSSGLYFLLFLYSAEIVAMAEQVNRGESKALFLVPIGIAFVFSFIHGMFTDRFWEALGLKAKR